MFAPLWHGAYLECTDPDCPCDSRKSRFFVRARPRAFRGPPLPSGVSSRRRRVYVLAHVTPRLFRPLHSRKKTVIVIGARLTAGVRYASIPGRLKSVLLRLRRIGVRTVTASARCCPWTQSRTAWSPHLLCSRLCPQVESYPTEPLAAEDRRASAAASPGHFDAPNPMANGFISPVFVRADTRGLRPGKNMSQMLDKHEIASPRVVWANRRRSW